MPLKINLIGADSILKLNIRDLSGTVKISGNWYYSLNVGFAVAFHIVSLHPGV